MTRLAMKLCDSNADVIGFIKKNELRSPEKLDSMLTGCRALKRHTDCIESSLMFSCLFLMGQLFTLQGGAAVCSVIDAFYKNVPGFALTVWAQKLA